MPRADAENPRAAEHPVHLVDAGGYVYDVAWAPHAPWLAVAAAPMRDVRTAFDAPLAGGAVQVWSVEGDVVQLRAVVRLAGGTPLRVAWHGSGALAASCADGSVRVVHVPSVDAPCEVEAAEWMVVRVRGAHAYSVAMAGDRLAVGCTNGVWRADAGDVVVVDVAARVTLAHAAVHDTLVSAVSWHLLPPVDVDGAVDVRAAPTTLLSVGYDGTEVVSDVAALCTPLRLAHTREPRYAAAWAPYGGLWVVDLGDQHYGSVSLRTHDAAQHHTLGFHHGRVRVRRAADAGGVRLGVPPVRRDGRRGGRGEAHQRAWRRAAACRGREPCDAPPVPRRARRRGVRGAPRALPRGRRAAARRQARW